jgi:hypothetical protein
MAVLYEEWMINVMILLGKNYQRMRKRIKG